MKVEEVMTGNVKSITVPGNREDAIELLNDLGTSAIPVLKEKTEEFIGTIRLRDLFENPEENQIGMLVNRDIAPVSPDELLEKAAKLILEKNARRLFVTENGNLVGVITVQDFLERAIKEMDEKTPVGDCLQKSVTAIWKSTPLDVALEILSLSGERALPVLDDNGELSGMIGEEDIIEKSQVETEEKESLMKGGGGEDRWAWDTEDRIYITKRSLKPEDKTVGEVMTTDPITVTKRSSADRCAEVMRENEINQIPVFSGGDLVGMVSD
ncbi:MAG: CBS domain-containing protein, partial [Candidatus Aenigmatarchaeota archaeon]